MVPGPEFPAGPTPTRVPRDCPRSRGTGGTSNQRRAVTCLCFGDRRLAHRESPSTAFDAIDAIIAMATSAKRQRTQNSKVDFVYDSSDTIARGQAGSSAPSISNYRDAVPMRSAGVVNLDQEGVDEPDLVIIGNAPAAAEAAPTQIGVHFDLNASDHY